MSDPAFHQLMCGFYSSESFPAHAHYTLADRVRYVNMVIDETGDRFAHGYPLLVLEERTGGGLTLQRQCPPVTVVLGQAS